MQNKYFLLCSSLSILMIFQEKCDPICKICQLHKKKIKWLLDRIFQMPKMLSLSVHNWIFCRSGWRGSSKLHDNRESTCPTHSFSCTRQHWQKFINVCMLLYFHICMLLIFVYCTLIKYCIKLIYNIVIL